MKRNDFRFFNSKNEIQREICDKCALLKVLFQSLEFERYNLNRSQKTYDA
jgi:hypothetical protein